MSVKTITAENFAAETESAPIVLDFWATWCGPCRMLSPVLDAAAEKKGFTVGKINVDEQPALADRFGIQVIPTLVFFKNGAEVFRTSGYMQQAELEFLADKHL